VRHSSGGSEQSKDKPRYSKAGSIDRSRDEEKIDILRDKGGRYNPKERQGN
jgi:hypothetical protein